MQSNKINFKGQNIFIGIDVHLNSWSGQSQPASAKLQNLFEELTAFYVSHQIKSCF